MKGVIGFYALLLSVAIVCTTMAFRPTGAMSCGDIDVNLSECIWYLAGLHPTPSLACCNGVRHLAKLGATVKDRRIACDCLRERIQHLYGIKDGLVNSLLGKCSAQLPYVKYLDQCDGGMP